MIFKDFKIIFLNYLLHFFKFVIFNSIENILKECYKKNSLQVFFFIIIPINI